MRHRWAGATALAPVDEGLSIVMDDVPPPYMYGNSGTSEGLYPNLVNTVLTDSLSSDLVIIRRELAKKIIKLPKADNDYD